MPTGSNAWCQTPRASATRARFSTRNLVRHQCACRSRAWFRAGMSSAVHFRTCPLCEATCGLEITVDRRQVARIRGDRDDVFSHGFICPKGSTLKQLHEDPDRLRAPQIRDARRPRRGDVGRGVRRDRAAAAADHRRARCAVGRRLPRQPERPQPVGPVLAAPVDSRARLAQHVHGVDRRPDAAARVVGADVRRPVRVRRARPRPHRLPADARRQPVRVERITGDRARLAGSARGDSGARRSDRGRRPAAHDDR